ncbi:MAG: hypothetical protein ABR570_08035 [Burkholderiales bacterium]
MSPASLLRRLMVAAGLLPVTSWTLADTLTPTQAVRKFGETVTVQFRVKGTGTNAAGYAELYSEASWRDPGAFFVRLPGTTEVARYAGRMISVSGEVQALQFAGLRRMVIYVPDVAQLTVLDPLPAFTPTAAYQPMEIGGFTVLVHPQVLQDRFAASQAFAELESQMAAIAAALPAPVLAKLREARIWLESRQREDTAAQFHPARAWLLSHGYNPEKAGDVEICHVRNWVTWSRLEQPSSLLHELAHAYHFRMLGENDPVIRNAYEHAMAARLYDAVPYAGGGRRQAHAAKNAAEYFAELSEAYFGRNDYYPFTRAELLRYDPIGYRMVKELWSARSSQGSIF